jgi:hypothetical protein
MNGRRGAGGPYNGTGGAKSGGPYTCAGKMGGFAARGGAYWPDIKVANPKMNTACKKMDYLNQFLRHFTGGDLLLRSL